MAYPKTFHEEMVAGVKQTEDAISKCYGRKEDSIDTRVALETLDHSYKASLGLQTGIGELDDNTKLILNHLEMNRMMLTFVLDKLADVEAKLSAAK